MIWRRAELFVYRLALAFIDRFAHDAASDVVGVKSMSCVSCFSIALDPTRTAGVSYAELVRVEKQRVGVSNIQLFFLSHKPVFSVGN